MSRFKTPEICREVIENFNGKSIGNKDNVLSIRFADTPDQKKLKTETAAKRQFKAHEYNISVYGSASPYQLSPAITGLPGPLQARFPAGNVYWHAPGHISPL
jgi:hypothetical protein